MKFTVLFIAVVIALAAFSPALAAQGQRASVSSGVNLKTSLEAMKKNVAKIGEADEATRWKANVELWQAVVASKPLPVGAFEKMKGNVAKIGEQGEKARWQSNVDLWQLFVSHKPKSDVAKSLLGKIKSIVAKIPAGSEKERWGLNVRMWESLIGSK